MHTCCLIIFLTRKNDSSPFSAPSIDSRELKEKNRNAKANSFIRIRLHLFVLFVINPYNIPKGLIYIFIPRGLQILVASLSLISLPR